MTGSRDADALIRLAFSGIGPLRVLRLLDGGAERALRQLNADSDLTDHQRAGLSVAADDRRAELESRGIRFCRLGSKMAFVPGCEDESPAWLFVRGRWPVGSGVAVIGSRRATSYGLSVARQIGAAIAQAGEPVISGLALGIDGAAHQGCVHEGGVTVAVLGSGVDVLYPARHRHLATQILDGGGAIVSEYPPGTRPEPWRFPLRNRIIAGLSRAVVVVEAAERSGALITARLALDMNLDVFAVPGDIDRLTSKGTNQLIRDGAHPVVSIEELMEGLGFTAPDQSRALEGLSVAAGERVAVDELITRHPDRSVADVMAKVALLEVEGRLIVDGGYVEVPRCGAVRP